MKEYMAFKTIRDLSTDGRLHLYDAIHLINSLRFAVEKMEHCHQQKVALNGLLDAGVALCAILNAERES